MIQSSEIPAALAHVAGAAKSRLLIVAPHVHDVVLDFIRRGATPDVRVEIVHHERIKAVIADRNLAVVLSRRWCMARPLDLPALPAPR